MPRPQLHAATFRPGNGMSLVPSQGEGQAEDKARGVFWRWCFNTYSPDGVERKRPGCVALVNSSGPDLILGIIPFQEVLGGPEYTVVLSADGTGQGRMRIRVLAGLNQVYWFDTDPNVLPFGKRVSWARVGNDLIIAGCMNGLYRLALDDEWSAGLLTLMDRDEEEFGLAGQDDGPYLAAPPNGDLIIAFEERWILSDGYSLRWCSPGDARGVPANNRLPVGYGEKHTGLFVHAGRFYVSTASATYRIEGDLQTATGTRVAVVSPTIGSASHWTTAGSASVTWVWTGRTVEAFDGVNFRTVSLPVGPLLDRDVPCADFGVDIEPFRALDGARSRAHATWHPTYGYALTYEGATSQGAPNLNLVLDRRGGWRLWRGPWLTAHGQFDNEWLSGGIGGTLFAWGHGTQDDNAVSAPDDYSIDLITPPLGVGSGAVLHFRDVVTEWEDVGAGEAALYALPDGRYVGAVPIPDRLVLDAVQVGHMVMGDQVEGAGLTTQRTGLPAGLNATGLALRIQSDASDVALVGIDLRYAPRRSRFASPTLEGS